MPCKFGIYCPNIKQPHENMHERVGRHGSAQHVEDDDSMDKLFGDTDEEALEKGRDRFNTSFKLKYNVRHFLQVRPPIFHG